MKAGAEELWAGGHLNEMYVGDDVHAKQQNVKLRGNLNYDNDVYSWLSLRFEIRDARDVFGSGFYSFGKFVLTKLICLSLGRRLNATSSHLSTLKL